MSYKHNNLMAMRQNYWSNESPDILSEKLFLMQQLSEHQVFNNPTLDDAKYLFFSLPSIVIVKGYAHGFTHISVQNMITTYIQNHKVQLSNKEALKIKFHM
ncbi:hypothetical protein [Acinetobacter tandoii]